MEDTNNPFNNIIQLEEITHFQKPHKQPPIKSILATHHKYNNLTSSTQSQLQQDSKHNFSDLPHLFRSNQGKRVSYSQNIDEKVHHNHNNQSSSPSPSPSSSSPEEPTNFDDNNSSENQRPNSSQNFDKKFHSINDYDYEDSSESDTEFRRDFTQLPTSGRSETSDNLSISSDVFDNNESVGGGGSGGGFFDRGISDENLFPLPNDIEVTKYDVFFAIIVFLIHFGEMVTDFSLAVWHYNNGQMWGSAFTVGFISLGSIAMLHQFGFIQPDHLDRTFRKGKRMRILVNCFPFAATSFISLEGAISAKKAIGDQMQSQQYWRISELCRAEGRVQSFFQAAPQAWLQLIIWMENLNDTSSDKGWMTFANIIFSLAVMTNANLPSKTDSSSSPSIDNQSSNISPAAYLPMSRIFVGLRMFSSLGSRCMAVSFLMVGCRCIVDHLDLNFNFGNLLIQSNSSIISSNNNDYDFSEVESSPTSSIASSTLTGICLLLFPRIIFTITDYCSMKRNRARNLEHYREQPELGVSSSHPIERIPLRNIWTGYLATIWFPVGSPFWLFWYLWCEAAIFIIFGNVTAFTHSCFDRAIAGVYTTIFVVSFIIIPCILPAVRAAVRRRRIQKVRRILHVTTDLYEPEMQNTNPC